MHGRAYGGADRRGDQVRIQVAIGVGAGALGDRRGQRFLRGRVGLEELALQPGCCRASAGRPAIHALVGAGARPLAAERELGEHGVGDGLPQRLAGRPGPQLVGDLHRPVEVPAAIASALLEK